jgi:hypothetical protein
MGDYVSNTFDISSESQQLMRIGRKLIPCLLASVFMFSALLSGAQTPSTYQPKFKGDPAHSEAESAALGYMRVVLRAQREYKKRHDKFAPSLQALAGTGSFTKRMARSNDRGDYTSSFHSKKDGFVLTMTPKQYDDQHRAFYAEDDGVIRAEEGKPATADSPKVK